MLGILRMVLYRRTVLSAFAQVADALRAIEHDAGAYSANVDTAPAGAAGRW